MRLIERDDYFDALDASIADHHSGYYAMYSSLLGGIVRDPLLMQVPVDDHVVHRGDGVFETLKCVDGGVYNLSAHLERFSQSMSLLDFECSWSEAEICEIVLETLKAAGRPDCSIRLMLSRGPGSFGVNPYDSVGSQLYVTVSKLKPGFMDLHPEGATLGVSQVAAKLSFFARVKNCNYLPNVLMKKEAVDMGLDFVAGFDSRGTLTEGATENIGIVTRGGVLAFPTLEGILRGTTMMRVLELAEEHMSSLGISGIEMRDIQLDEMRNAGEILIVGTTPDVTSVRVFDDSALGGKVPGPVGEGLYKLLLDDIHNNINLRTMFSV